MRGSTQACLALSVLAAGMMATALAGAQPAPDSAPESTPQSEQPLTPPAPMPAQAQPAPAPAPYTPPPYSPQAPGQPYYPAQPAPAPPPPAQPPEDSAQQARIGEAHADRVLLLPTAYTHPAGTVYLSSYEIVLLQAGYAFTDHTQLTLTATPPLGADAIFPLDVSLKHVVVRDGPVRAALIGSMTGLMGLNEGNIVLGRFGGVAQLCFEDACESSVNMATTVLLAGPVTVAVTGAGAIWRATSWLALLAEFDTVVPFGREAGEANGAGIGLGVRFPFRRVSVDLGLVRPFGVGVNAPALPWVAVTYRFLP